MNLFSLKESIFYKIRFIRLFENKTLEWGDYKD